MTTGMGSVDGAEPRVVEDRMVGSARFIVAEIRGSAPTLCRDCRVRVRPDDEEHNEHRLGAFNNVRDPWIALLDLLDPATTEPTEPE